GNGDIFCNIISFTNPDSVISSVHYNNEIKSKKSLLSQNYPNPFNGLTKISYRIESNAFVRISIYNILGKEVTILVNGFHNTGSYVTSLSIDAINLSTGLYFYKIFTNEEFKEVKKLVIIK
ncbi:MAG: T9SS type A sorting domain-containing protein, partial [Ignavibacteria bacterium]